MDPFNTAANQAVSTIRDLEGAYNALKNEIAVSSCPCNLTSSLEFDKKVCDVREDLRLLHDATKTASSDPKRFGISDKEIVRRRRNVEEIESDLEKINNAKVYLINQARQNCPVDGKEKSLYVFDDKFSSQNIWQDHDQLNREMLAKQQDERLAEIARNSSRLAGVAHSMNRELVSQNIVIDDLQYNVESQLGATDFIIKRVGSVLRTNSRRQIKQVLSLFCVFLILVALLIII